VLDVSPKARFLVTKSRQICLIKSIVIIPAAIALIGFTRMSINTLYDSLNSLPQNSQL
jgi:hypothetical protein